MADTEEGCTHVRLGAKHADDRACSLARGHDGPHDYTVKPDGHGGWSDGKQ